MSTTPSKLECAASAAMVITGCIAATIGTFAGIYFLFNTIIPFFSSILTWNLISVILAVTLVIVILTAIIIGWESMLIGTTMIVCIYLPLKILNIPIENMELFSTLTIGTLFIAVILDSIERFKDYKDGDLNAYNFLKPKLLKGYFKTIFTIGFWLVFTTVALLWSSMLLKPLSTVLDIWGNPAYKTNMAPHVWLFIIVTFAISTFILTKLKGPMTTQKALACYYLSWVPLFSGIMVSHLQGPTLANFAIGFALGCYSFTSLGFIFHCRETIFTILNRQWRS